MPKLVYKISDGSIRTMGYFNSEALLPGEAIEDYDGPIPESRVDFYKRTAPGVIEEKTQVEKDILIEMSDRPSESEFATFFDGLTDGRKLEVLKKIVVKMAHNFITKKDFKNL